MEAITGFMLVNPVKLFMVLKHALFVSGRDPEHCVAVGAVE